MSYDAKVLADSLSPAGVRLTTIEVTFPRFILAEFNTHRMFSRNGASSRAIPVEKRIAMVQSNPFVPESFGKNQKGMRARETIADADAALARNVWMTAAAAACSQAAELSRLEVHKQLANRLLEPFCWHTAIVTATEWENFWALRSSPMAQPEIFKAATLMKAVFDASEPHPVDYGDWHLPLCPDAHDLSVDGYPLEKISAARCARVSYLTHDGKRDPDADLTLFDRLASSGHLSPLEHVATPVGWKNNEGSRVAPGWEASAFIGNFRGWQQLRKLYPHEDNFAKVSK